jgi:hypothetical protein
MERMNFELGQRGSTSSDTLERSCEADDCEEGSNGEK